MWLRWIIELCHSTETFLELWCLCSTHPLLGVFDPVICSDLSKPHCVLRFGKAPRRSMLQEKKSRLQPRDWRRAPIPVIEANQYLQCRAGISGAMRQAHIWPVFSFNKHMFWQRSWKSTWHLWILIDTMKNAIGTGLLQLLQMAVVWWFLPKQCLTKFEFVNSKPGFEGHWR